MKNNPDLINPKLDLVLERVVDVPVELVWEAWTDPAHLKHWFVPRPWTVKECEVEVRPGGKFHFVMQSPEGQDYPNLGCYLEIVEKKKLVWTSALLPGYRPVSTPTNGADMLFTAIILLEAQGEKTKYTAIAVHPDEPTCKRHEEMGFHDGWGTCLDQLVEYMKK